MKKIISVLMVAVCLMMAAPVQAQLHFGVKGGLNLSKASFSKDALKGDNQTGWFIGPMAEFTLPIIGVGADIAALYSQTDLAAKGYDTDAKLKTFEIPLFGLYGACSTCGEALALSAMTVAAGYADRVAAVTSSHFASAEKQFRFPLEYANQRPVSATWTVTGGGAFILSKDAKQPLAKVAGVTTGKIVDYGIKDSMNMGAVMAPAAAELIAQNLTDFKRKPEDYDRIITGDLGEVGQQILFDLLLKKGMDIRKQHEDCGMLIFDSQTQGTGSGGSGCGCAASVLSAHFLPKLASGELKRILFVPTGALLSTVSFNEGQTIPGIAHGVVLESCISSAKKEG